MRREERSRREKESCKAARTEKSSAWIIGPLREETDAPWLLRLHLVVTYKGIVKGGMGGGGGGIKHQRCETKGIGGRPHRRRTGSLRSIGWHLQLPALPPAPPLVLLLLLPLSV